MEWPQIKKLYIATLLYKYDLFYSNYVNNILINFIIIYIYKYLMIHANTTESSCYS